MAPSKRRLVSSSSQSTQSSQQSTTTRGPPKKRARHSPPHPTSLPPQTLPSTDPRASTSTSKPLEKEDVKPSLPEAKKRHLHPGSLRRLTTSRPSTSTTSSTTTINTDNRARARDNQTLSGNKIGGKSKDLKDGSKVEEIWVRNFIKKKGKGGEGGVGGGMGFSAWLKKGVGAFVERGCTCLKVHGMAATIPTALSLALAIRDAIPGGSPLDEDSRSSISGDDDDDDLGDSGEEGQEKEGNDEGKRERKRGIFRMQVLTGTTVVGDEITPLDDDEDMIYQCRSKSTIEIVLTLDEELGKMVGVGKTFARKDGGGGRGRGAKRRGGMRGRGMGRGRGK